MDSGAGICYRRKLFITNPATNNWCFVVSFGGSAMSSDLASTPEATQIWIQIWDSKFEEEKHWVPKETSRQLCLYMHSGKCWNTWAGFRKTCQPRKSSSVDDMDTLPIDDEHLPNFSMDGPGSLWSIRASDSVISSVLMSFAGRFWMAHPFQFSGRAS